jgi:hypothetical protein
MPRTPVGAILESSLLREDDKAAGVLLRLRLIPLEEGRLNIPGFKVSVGDYSLDIPALSIPVSRNGSREAASPAPVSEAPGSSPVEPPPSPEPQSRKNLPFPKTLPEPLPPFRAGYGNIRERAAALWDRGLRVEALAELRRNERDYAGGPALIPLRREVEKLLGISGNGDETWRPRLLLAGIFAVSAGLALAFLFLSFPSFPKKVTPGPAWCYKIIRKPDRFREPGGFVPAFGKNGERPGSPDGLREGGPKTGLSEQPRSKKTTRLFRFCTVVFALPALFSLWRLGAFSLSGPSFPGNSGLSRTALTRDAEVFRVPGPEGTVVFRLEEGRRVLVRSLQGEWAYAETEISGQEEGGRSGWVKTGALVFY